MSQEIIKAGEGEKNLAIERNDFFQGVPSITVVVDGGWSKRSHKHSYNAKSGVALIVGKETNKLLYLGIRNKFCSICTIAHNKKLSPKKHTCYKNWSGSSSEMEVDILLSGFNAAEAMHGLRYMRVIGDGDSSVISNIQQYVRIWGNMVHKVECANHAMKCYRNRLEKIVVDFPMYKGKRGLTQKAIKRLVVGARCAIKMHSSTKNVQQLRKDLRNGPSHVFNDHTHCSPTFCKVVAKTTETNQVELADGTTEPPSNSIQDSTQDTDSGLSSTLEAILTEEVQQAIELHNEEDEARGQSDSDSCSRKNIPDDLFFQILRAGDRLVSMAPQLISNSTSNIAESFMNIRCKFDGGKFYNRIQRGSFQHRTYGAGLRFQLGPDWSSKVWSEATGAMPGELRTTFGKDRVNQHEKMMKRKSSVKYKENRKKAKYSTSVDSSAQALHAYGTQSVQPPLPSEEVHLLCKEFRESISVTEEEAKKIEEDTIQQGDDPTGLWNSLRRPRLTSSNFGAICKRRKTTPVANAVKNFLYKTISSNVSSLRWGRENEENARKSYIEEMAKRGTPVNTKRSGLVISTSNPCLASSPDGWVEDNSTSQKDGIVEFKCPYASRDVTPSEACSKKDFFCTLEEGQVKLKNKHNYYYQVQGAMAISKKPWCDFVVWTPKGISIQRIQQDSTFWSDSMLPKLLSFYENALLPELAAPEHPNGRPIREPGTW